MASILQTLVILVAVVGLLLSFTRLFSPLRTAQQLGRVGDWFVHEDDLELDELPDVNQIDPPIPYRPLRGRG